MYINQMNSSVGDKFVIPGLKIGNPDSWFSNSAKGRNPVSIPVTILRGLEYLETEIERLGVAGRDAP